MPDKIAFDKYITYFNNEISKINPIISYAHSYSLELLDQDFNKLKSEVKDILIDNGLELVNQAFDSIGDFAKNLTTDIGIDVDIEDINKAVDRGKKFGDKYLTKTFKEYTDNL